MSAISFQIQANACPIVALTADELAHWCNAASPAQVKWVESLGYTARPGEKCLLSNTDGELAAVLIGVDAEPDRFALAGLANSLPDRQFFLEGDWSAEQEERMALGWALAAYRFARYKKNEGPVPVLAISERCNRTRIEAAVAAHYQVRDLINTPTEDLGPAELGEAVVALGSEFGAEVTSIVGDDLLAANMRAIHAVGRASNRPPRLVDLVWGEHDWPKLTLVGKGVCFDTGGLNLKPAAGMRLMKKDMGGAAHAIGLARMVMAANLPVRLRVLISAVENAVSASAYRPGDIITAKNGMTIEIDNTDAEGRVILCDALTVAGEESPELIIDFATLTGAARVALGTDLPAMFCTKDATADGIRVACERTGDPVWRLPLFKPYRKLIDSPVADIVNSAASPFGGAIVAALFLQDFVADDADWVHFDLMAWNIRARPGRPEGGEAMSMHALFHYLCGRFS